MKKRNPAIKYVLSFFLVLAAVFFVNRHEAVARAAGADRIYYFNMDDKGLEGSMMLVESNGHWGLVDAGHTKATTITDASGRTYSTTVNGLSSQVYCRNGADVANYMINTLGVRHLDFIVGTHAHSDHVGGIPGVAAATYRDSSGRTMHLVDSTTTYYYKEYKHISDLEDDLVRYSSDSWHNQAFAYQAKVAMANQGAQLIDVSTSPQVVQGDPGNAYGDYVTFTVGNMSFRLYNVHEQTNTGNENVNSIVTVMTNGYYSVVNLADINTNNGAIDKTSQAIAKDFGSVDVVVAGHHGFTGSNTKNMFDSLQPSFVVVPNGMEESWLYTDGDLAAALPYAQSRYGTAFYNLTISPYAVVTDLSGRQVYVYTVNGSGDLANAIDKMMKSANKTGWVSWMQTNGTIWSYLENGNSVKNDWRKVDGKWYFFDGTGIMYTGWLNRGGAKYYLFSDTGEAAVGWQLLNGKWYYFDQKNADMKTGWQEINGSWYLFDGSGVMQTGWITRGGHTYYLFSSGEMATGWQRLGGKMYYFRPDQGYLETPSGWQFIDGKTYLFDGNGVMQTGWVNRGGQTYYFFSDTGEAAYGWQRLGGKWYYFDQKNADMKTGWQFIDGKMYLFDGNGVMQTGWVTRGGQTYYLFSSGEMATGWQRIGGKMYYFRPGQGYLETPSGWQFIDGKIYLFDGNGIMQTGWVNRGGQTYYFFSDTGEAAYGWQQLGGKWYYFDLKDAYMKTGWQEINGSWYLFDSSGVMQTGWITRGGQTYYLFSSGEMATGWQRIGGKMYYFRPEQGYLETPSGWQFIDGKTYLFDGNGVMQTGWVNRGGQTYYFFSDTGEAAYGWQQLGGKWYYFDLKDAYMKTGWQQIDGKWYYLDLSDGHMLENTTVDGYYINSDGVWVP